MSISFKIVSLCCFLFILPFGHSNKKQSLSIYKCQALFWALEILSAENRPRNPAFTDLTFRLGNEWQRQTIKISLLIHKWCCLNEMKWRSMFNNERNQHLHLRKWSPIMKEYPKEKCSVSTLYKDSATADREGLLCFVLGQVILTGARLAHQPIRSYHAVTSGAP